MDRLTLRLTDRADGPILGCARCDTAMLPEGELPRGGPALLRCPLCGWEQQVLLVEVGPDEAFPYNPREQRQDAGNTPVHRAEGVDLDGDLLLVTVPHLLEDPAFAALQDGYAPVSAFGWVGGAGVLGEPGYRLLLIVRVENGDGPDLFRIEFPAGPLEALAAVTAERSVVLVSQRKGVLFPEAGEVYARAAAEAGGRPGDQLTMNEWVSLQ